MNENEEKSKGRQISPVFKDQVLERNDTGFDRNGEEEPKYTEGNDPVFFKSENGEGNQT